MPDLQTPHQTIPNHALSASPLTDHPPILPVIAPTMSPTHIYKSKYQSHPHQLINPNQFFTTYTTQVLVIMGSHEGLGLEITELRLGLLPSNNNGDKKRVYSATVSDENSSNADHVEVNQSKTQVVGWPPVCSYRRKNTAKKAESSTNFGKIYVKVSMDGAPFLRKIDLNTQKGYPDLVSTFGKLFGCYGNISGGVLRDSDNLEYIPIYEDKDGDWMLVGDVPWEMFIESCKRLRIMKRIEGKGFDLEPRNFKGNLQGLVARADL
ncbi:hypothetical protein Sjap_019377 [Stephania japonica]|uniref:Auxin-responsive protein n=1 Tax=Stephania japonica TaxID=461633 RepID=A0AAP0F3Y1_9MAGN